MARQSANKASVRGNKDCLHQRMCHVCLTEYRERGGDELWKKTLVSKGNILQQITASNIDAKLHFQRLHVPQVP